MKRLLSIFLAGLVLISLLPGCGERVKEPVTFYYLHSSYQEKMDAPIASEVRETAGHRDNLKYLLSFYLMGPVDKELYSPLPRGTVLYQIEQAPGSVTITLSDTTNALSDSEFSLACACLSLTCMDLVSASEVTVISGNRDLTMRRDNLILTDIPINEETGT